MLIKKHMLLTFCATSLLCISNAYAMEEEKNEEDLKFESREEASLSDPRQTRQQLIAQVQSLKERLETRQQQMSDVVDTYESEKDSLQTAYNKLEQAARKFKTEKEQEIENLRKDIAEWVSSNNTQTTNLATLQKEKAALESKIKKAEEEIEQLGIKIKTTQASNKEWENLGNKQISDIKNLEAKMQEAQINYNAFLAKIHQLSYDVEACDHITINAEKAAENAGYLGALVGAGVGALSGFGILTLLKLTNADKKVVGGVVGASALTGAISGRYIGRRMVYGSPNIYIKPVTVRMNKDFSELTKE